MWPEESKHLQDISRTTGFVRSLIKQKAIFLHFFIQYVFFRHLLYVSHCSRHKKGEITEGLWPHRACNLVKEDSKEINASTRTCVHTYVCTHVSRLSVSDGRFTGKSRAWQELLTAGQLGTAHRRKRLLTQTEGCRWGYRRVSAGSGDPQGSGLGPGSQTQGRGGWRGTRTRPVPGKDFGLYSGSEEDPEGWKQAGGGVWLDSRWKRQDVDWVPDDRGQCQEKKVREGQDEDTFQRQSQAEVLFINQVICSKSLRTYKWNTW